MCGGVNPLNWPRRGKAADPDWDLSRLRFWISCVTLSTALLSWVFFISTTCSKALDHPPAPVLQSLDFPVGSIQFWLPSLSLCFQVTHHRAATVPTLAMFLEEPLWRACPFSQGDRVIRPKGCLYSANCLWECSKKEGWEMWRAGTRHPTPAPHLCSHPKDTQQDLSFTVSTQEMIWRAQPKCTEPLLPEERTRKCGLPSQWTDCSTDSWLFFTWDTHMNLNFN